MKMVKNPLNENQFTLATSGGIFTSVDNGENWEQISPLFAHNIAHSTYHDGQMVAVVHNSNASGFALRYTEDSGQTWETIDSSELFHLNSTHVFTSSAIVFGEDFADVYIATADLGLVKFTLDLNSLSVSEPEFISEQMTTIYPNPATDFVNIAGKEEIGQIEIFNMAGQKILNSSADKIKVSHLTKGIYL